MNKILVFSLLFLVGSMCFVIIPNTAYADSQLDILVKITQNTKEHIKDDIDKLNDISQRVYDLFDEGAKETALLIQATEKEDTDSDYNQALTLCIENIDIVSVCAGTHNEESSSLLVDLLENHNISKDDKRVYFSQLLGMSDHISYNAAKKGFNVVKYVPYGPVKDVLPYLIRRAKENTSIAGQMGRELTNIIEEKKRRRR